MIRRTFADRRFLTVAVLTVGLFLTTAAELSAPLNAQTTGAANLTVRVSGARNAKGKIRVALFRDGKGFPNDASQAVHTEAADIDPHALSAQIVFADLPAGVYTVSVFHDENMNEKLDKNFMGVPKEGYGASNNPKKKMGPPNFDETKFRLGVDDQSVEIKLMFEVRWSRGTSAYHARISYWKHRTLGKHLVRTALDAGHEVWALARSNEKAQRELGDMLFKWGLEIFET